MRNSSAKVTLTLIFADNSGTSNDFVSRIIFNDLRMAEGTIKKLTDKGFGFIKVGDGKDLFFHMKNLQGVRFEELREGQKVSYTEGQGPKGPCAENVKPV